MLFKETVHHWFIFRVAHSTGGTQPDLELLISIIVWSVLFCKSHEDRNACCNFTSCHECVCLCLCSVRGVIPDRLWLRGQPGSRPDPSLRPHPASTTPQSKQTCCPPSAQFTTATSYGEGAEIVRRVARDHSYCKYAQCCPVLENMWKSGRP